MTKKRNQDLRTRRDARARKSMTDGKGWAENLLEEIEKGEQEQEIKIKRRKKGARCNAKRHTSDSL